MKKLTIVAPMYNEKDMVPYFFEKINEVVSKITNYQVTILCVNDGSKDNTLELLKKQREIQDNIHIVSFSRNFGHEAAVAAGLKQADGDIVVVMDADLQDPPELMLEMIKKYESGYDVVNAKRINREKDPFLKRVTAEMFYSFIAKLSGKIKIPYNVGNYRLMSRRVVDYVNALKEKNHVFRIQVPYVGFKTTEVEFVRPKRLHGETHYNYKSMFSLAGDSITSSSTMPLRWSFFLGLVLGFLATVGFIAFLVLYFIGRCGNSILLPYIDIFSLGMTFTFISIWGSILLLIIGIVGEYVGRILIESQDRPLYYIEEEIKAKEE